MAHTRERPRRPWRPLGALCCARAAGAMLLAIAPERVDNGPAYNTPRVSHMADVHDPGPYASASGYYEGQEIGGGYNLVKLRGSGGFGEVWQAAAPGGIPAAVKVIFRPIQRAEAQRELYSLELLKWLRHVYLL